MFNFGFLLDLKCLSEQIVAVTRGTFAQFHTSIAFISGLKGLAHSDSYLNYFLFGLLSLAVHGAALEQDLEAELLQEAAVFGISC